MNDKTQKCYVKLLVLDMNAKIESKIVYRNITWEKSLLISDRFIVFLKFRTKKLPKPSSSYIKNQALSGIDLIDFQIDLIAVSSCLSYPKY